MQHSNSHHDHWQHFPDRKILENLRAGSTLLVVLGGRGYAQSGSLYIFGINDRRDGSHQCLWSFGSIARTGFIGN